MLSSTLAIVIFNLIGRIICPQVEPPPAPETNVPQESLNTVVDKEWKEFKEKVIDEKVCQATEEIMTKIQNAAEEMRDFMIYQILTSLLGKTEATEADAKKYQQMVNDKMNAVRGAIDKLETIASRNFSLAKSGLRLWADNPNDKDAFKAFAFGLLANSLHTFGRMMEKKLEKKVEEQKEKVRIAKGGSGDETGRQKSSTEGETSTAWDLYKLIKNALNVSGWPW